jgi:hypothetical protein
MEQLSESALNSLKFEWTFLCRSRYNSCSYRKKRTAADMELLRDWANLIHMVQFLTVELQHYCIYLSGCY